LQVIMQPRPEGFGVKANSILRSICYLAGIKDLSAKVIGSHYSHNTVKAVFKALASIKSPERRSEILGRPVVDDITLSALRGK